MKPRKWNLWAVIRGKRMIVYPVQYLPFPEPGEERIRVEVKELLKQSNGKVKP